MAALAEEHELPVENLLTPDYLRRVLWTPPATREPDELARGGRRPAHRAGARGWQIELVAPPVVQARRCDADAYSEDATPTELPRRSESGGSGS